jgi:hypothetical protein
MMDFVIRRLAKPPGGAQARTYIGQAGTTLIWCLARPWHFL